MALLPRVLHAIAPTEVVVAVWGIAFSLSYFVGPDTHTQTQNYLVDTL